MIVNGRMRVLSVTVPRVFICLAASAFFAGCTVQIVQKKSPRKGPVPEVGLIDNGNGEVRYSTEGWGWVVAARRKTAFRKIAAICKAMKFKIVDEFTHNDMEVPYSQEELKANLDHGLEHYNVSPFHHLIFDCVPESKK